MFAIPGLLALIALIYIRPQEFVKPLQAVPLLYIALALAVLGLIVDLRLRRAQFRASPQLLWVILLFGWALVTVLIYDPRTLPLEAMDLGIAFVLYLVIGHGIHSFRALHGVGAAALALALFVAGVGVHQGFQDTGCVLIDESNLGDKATGTFDGRSCQTNDECYLGDAEPGGTYICEKIGLFGTNSVSGGRVRYRGVLQDPNELALAAGIGIPFAFAVGWRKRLAGKWLIVAATLAVVLSCVIMTGSRGGELVLLAVLAAYFLKRFGWKGAVVGAVVGLPVLLLGGRGGEEASSSTMERIDCWYEAISLLRMSPAVGVGLHNFGEYHYLTAHNSYLLAGAELGLPGFLLFNIVIYITAKIPFAVLRRYQSGSAALASVPEGVEVARVWAMALMAATTGLVVGIFFLSFTFHHILWIYVGLSAALYHAVRRHDPEFEVGFGWRDATLVGAGSVAMLGAVYLLTKLMLG